MELERFVPEDHITHGYGRYYRKMGRYSVFVRAYGVRMDGQTRSNWSELMMLARGADNFVDSSVNDTEARGRELAVLRYYNDGLADHYPNLIQIGPERIYQLKILTDYIFELGREYKRATNVNDFAVARAEEGRVFADMFGVACEPETSSQPGFNAFWNVFSRCAVASNFLNSAIGLKDDYESGQMAIEPTLSNRAQLIINSVKGGLEAIPSYS